jgi:hypothetical protein
VATAFGVLAALAGAEHGVGEVLQGSVRPPGIVFQSWPNAAFFRIEAGEPAMSLIPNLLASGVLTLLVSFVFLVWAVRFVDRKHGGLVLLGLSVPLLLVGGGFGPPLLGVIAGLTATRIGAPLRWWRARPPRLRGAFASSWPWVFAACLFSWLMLVPGLPLLDYTVGIPHPMIVAWSFLGAMGLLVPTIVAGLAHDADQPPATERSVAGRRGVR